MSKNRSQSADFPFPSRDFRAGISGSTFSRENPLFSDRDREADDPHTASSLESEFLSSLDARPQRSSLSGTSTTRATERAAQLMVQQEELDHRENQLNARMAQFENLVRNTKISLQAKMEEVSQREEDVRALEEQYDLQRTSQEEWIRNERNAIENERFELQARKSEIEERLSRRERELHEIAAEREAEIVAQVQTYRDSLDAKLIECKSEYQDRYETRCREVETEFARQLTEEQEQYRALQQALENDFENRILQIDREVSTKKEDLESRFVNRMGELEHHFELRKRELEEAYEHRVERVAREYEQKRKEIETRFERREEQLVHRESLIRQAEEDWNGRRELFENQWNEFEQLRKVKHDELTRRESKAEERDHYLIELEAKLKKKELEQTALDEALKVRERQIALDAQKFANLQQLEADTMESQAEAGRIRESLVRERHQMQKTAEAERKRLREAQELALRRLEEERQDLVQQNKRLEQMRLAMDRSREELGRMHRETLEIRLATEELWLRLSGESDSEDLKKSVCEIRTRLAAQYQDVAQRLDLQKSELKENREEMLQQYEALMARREEVDRWIARNEDTIREKEKALQERETELERQRQRLEELHKRTQAERVEMEKEVKLLQEQIDRAFAA